MSQFLRFSAYVRVAIVSALLPFVTTFVIVVPTPGHQREHAFQFALSVVACLAAFGSVWVLGRVLGPKTPPVFAAVSGVPLGFIFLAALYVATIPVWCDWRNGCWL